MNGLDVREMRPSDLPAVAAVDMAAFSFAAVHSGRPPLESPRHTAGLEYFRRMAPALCLVAEHGGTVCGYTIGHRWGATAWIGPVGVAPELMGRGIGTALLDAFRECSLAAGATTIGLETSILGNVRLYERRGYRAAALRLLLAKDLARGPAPEAAQAAAAAAQVAAPSAARVAAAARPEDEGPSFSVMPLMELEPGERHRLGAESRLLAGLVEPGLDHSEELSSVPESGMGETLVALDKEGRLAGYAAMYLKELRAPGMDIRKASTASLVWIMNGWPDACVALAAGCERVAAAAGAARLEIPCYAANAHGFALLKSLRYSPAAAFVRMLQAGQVNGSAGKVWQSVPLDFSCWMG